MKYKTITLCMGSSCYSRGNRDNLIKMREFVWENDLRSKIVLKGCRCGGCCSNGPNIWIDDELHPEMTEENMHKFLEHLRNDV